MGWDDGIMGSWEAKGKYVWLSLFRRLTVTGHSRLLGPSQSQSLRAFSNEN
jgi:hypothetical protein